MNCRHGRPWEECRKCDLVDLFSEPEKPRWADFEPEEDEDLPFYTSQRCRNERKR